MARWGKLFQGKSKSRDYTGRVSPESKTEWFLPTFDKSQIRLVLFLDHEIRGRHLLLDSHTVRKNEPRQTKVAEVASKPRGFSVRLCKKPPAASSVATSSSSPVTSPEVPKYQFNTVHSSSDVRLFEEMIFGTAALAYKGPSLKVHTLKCPQQLLISSVFIPNCKSSRACVTTSDGDCTVVDPLMGPASLAEATGPREIAATAPAKAEIAHSLPMDVPKSNREATSQSRDHDSGFSNSSLTSSGSWQQVSFPPSPSSSCSVNSSSCNSLQRRWRRSLQWCLDYGVPKPQPRYSNYDDASTTCPEPTPARLRRPKVGMGIIFKETNEEAAQRMQEFFFSHVTLVEGRMNKLRLVVEAARFGKPNWQVAVMEAFEEFQQEICDLYTAPRLPNPVWLDMMTLTLHRRVLCDSFMKEFSGLIEKCDTKHTNFFLSTLLTATLTYHLSWVPTVIPAGVTPSRTHYSDKHTAKWLDLLARSHPYNPLWAQLSDLCGAIGSPVRLSRTVVIGKKADVVRRLLYMLSYFIRCTEIHENAEEYIEQDYAVVSSGTAVESASTSGASCVELHSYDSLMSAADSNDAPVPSEGRASNAYAGDSGVGGMSVKESHNNTSADHRIPVVLADSLPLTAHAQADAATIMRATCSAAEKVDLWMWSCTVDDDAADSAGSIEHAQAAASYSVGCHSGSSVVDAGIDVSSSATARCVLSELGPLTARREHTRSLGRAVRLGAEVLARPLLPQANPAKLAPNDDRQQVMQPIGSREQLRRLFSQELDEFDEYFNETDDQTTCCRPAGAEPGCPSAGTAPTGAAEDSIFDEYFDEGSVPIGLLASQPVVPVSCNALCCRASQCPTCCLTAAANEAMAKRHHSHPLLKVAKESGFLNWSERQRQATQLTQPASYAGCHYMGESESSRRNPSGSSGAIVCRQPSSAGDESSSCSTPKTLRCTTPNIATVDSGLGPRRHTSGSSAVPAESNISEPFRKYVEVPMPRSQSTRSCSRAASDAAAPSAANFGRSQLAGYSDHYLSDVVLHGTSDTQFERKLQSDLDLAVHFPILDEPVAEAVCIIANTDTWVVQIASSMKTTDEFEKKSVMAAPLVVSMVESVQSLYKQKVSSEFCMMHLEDTLREMYFKSRMLAEYVNSQKKVNMDDLSAMLGFDISDLPLLLSVAATHSTLLIDGLY